MTRFQQTAFMVFAFLFAGGMLLSGIMIWSQLISRQRDIDTFNDLQQLVMQTTSVQAAEDAAAQTTQVTEKPLDDIQVPDADENTEQPESNADSQPDSEAVETPSETTAVQAKRNLSALMERNADCIGWIYIEDTVVDYPVMHTPEEPEKYLRRSFDKAYSHSGVPFMDWRCTLGSDNRIIYGHNMKNHTMFSDVVNYADESYCQENPVIEFETETGCEVYEVFAVVRTDSADQWYLFIEAQDSEDYDLQISYIKSRALYDTGITPVYGQKLITLSTCEYTSDDARLLVIAVQKQ